MGHPSALGPLVRPRHSHTPVPNKSHYQCNHSNSPIAVAHEQQQQHHENNYGAGGRVQDPRRPADPSVAENLNKIKRMTKATHRLLEILCEDLAGAETADVLRGIRIGAWQTYRRVVRLEEMYRGEGECLRFPADGYLPGGFASVTQVLDGDGGDGENAMLAFPVQPVEVHRTGEDRSHLMSGALPSKHMDKRGSRPVLEVLDIERTEARVAHIIDALDAQHQANGVPSVGDRKQTKASQSTRSKRRDTNGMRVSIVITQSRDQVAASLDKEESSISPTLHDPGRIRQGSLPPGTAASCILQARLNPSWILPSLRFIKIHELKALLAWLTAHNLLGASSALSPAEKLLHLLFALQEGLRYETLAVLFSRSPRQVRSACHEAFAGLRELHSETALPERQPACDHLWDIGRKYFASPVGCRLAEAYYGWPVVEVTEVLVTLNLFVGRYRQYGRMALAGPYQRWWKWFRPDG